MTSAPAPRLNSGWILVSGLLAFCVLGTWLTARNYRQQVFTSISAVVLENQWPESRISATFSPTDAKRLRPGQQARITVGTDKTLIPGRVLEAGMSSAGSGAKEGNATIAVIGEVGNSRSASEQPRHHLSAGASCSVSIDTSIPVDAVTAPSPTR